LATALYGLAVAAMVVTARGEDRVAAATIGLEGLALSAFVRLLMAGRLERRFLRRHGGEPREAPLLAARLAGSGVRRLFVLPSTKLVGSAFRRGPTAYVAVHPAILRRHDAATRFVLAHELAHLARSDTARRIVVVAYATAAGGAALVETILQGRHRWALWLLPLAYLAVLTGFNWTRELDCDRLAVATGGRDGALLCLARLRDASRRAVAGRSTWPGRAKVWLALRLDLLVHPPLRLRHALASRWRQPRPDGT
jgi:Zn-dependent protease with chaperone function